MIQSRFRLTAKPDSRAGGQLQTTTLYDGQQYEERSTRRTSVNASKQALASPPFGITRLLMSVVVDSTLAFPPQRLLVSLKIVCCLAVFLSTFLSAYTA
jgi:hypothetical protein